MSLPNFLTSTYRQYKGDTNVFTTWLNQAARACGYKSASKPVNAAQPESTPATPHVTSRRLKGKDRKLAMQAASSSASKPTGARPDTVKYAVSSRELLQQAKLVAASDQKAAALPGGIRFVLQRAIALRNRCAEHYKNLSSVDEPSNDSRKHFNATLQDALNLFKRAEPFSGNPSTPDQSIELINAFSALEAEDVDEEYPLTPVDISAALDSKSSGERAKKAIYELEEDHSASVEDAINLFCFWEDLQRIQDHIKDVWRKFAAGKVSLNIATIVTQAGLDIIKRLEEEALQRLRNSTQGVNVYTKMAMPVFRAETLRQGGDPREILDSRTGFEHRPIYDFISLQVYDTLQRFAEAARISGNEGWPPAVHNARTSLIDCPELAGRPEYAEVVKKDDLLIKILLELHILDESQTMVDKANTGATKELVGLVFAKNELAKYTTDLWKEGMVTSRAVFACRIVLDILDICGEKPSFYATVVERGNIANATVGLTKTATGYTSNTSWPPSDGPAMNHLATLINQHIRAPVLGTWKQVLLSQHAQNRETSWCKARDRFRKFTERNWQGKERTEEARQAAIADLDIGPVQPAAETDFLHTHNPLYSGMLGLRLSAMMEERGVALANIHLSVHAAAYIHHALKQQKLTKIHWPDMDRLIELQCDALFAKELPQTPLEMYKRMGYRTGLDKAHGERSRRKHMYKFREATASKALTQLFESTGAIEHALLQLESQIDEHASTDVIQKTKKSGTLLRRQMHPLQVLSRLEEYLPVVLEDIEFDYITLTKICDSLMEAVQLRLNKSGVFHERTDDFTYLEIVYGMSKEN